MGSHCPLVRALALTLILAATCLAGPPSPLLSRPVCKGISPERFLAETRLLASDAFEGRGPGTAGEERTVDHLVETFRAAGLVPALGPDRWTQAVPILGVRSTVTAGWLGVTNRPMEFPQDLVAWGGAGSDRVEVGPTPMVFAGHGITAPEYGWDDYKDVDVRGKTVVVLIGDPAVPDPRAAGKLDPRVFGGVALTYYGRWTYKYEEAARRGAAAVLIIHETGAASYPWFVVVNSWGRERFELAGDRTPRSALQGWLALETARELLALNGLTYEGAVHAATQKGFRPVTLGQRFQATATQRERRVESRNVVGLLRGSDPRLRDQYVVYSAHWDHLGRDERLTGDQIFNGAADNAVGVAGLVELARSYGALGRAPRRSVAFVATTAEEQGLLGARFFVQEPALPPAAIVANLNIDGLNTWGRTLDIQQIGLGHSGLDDVVAGVVRKAGRVLLPDPHPERGMFFRSDHFEFMKAGIPAVYLKAGSQYLDRPASYGQARLSEYIQNDYHKVSDEVRPDWDLAGAVEDTRVLAEIGWRLADGNDWPQWKRGSEFSTRARRGAAKAGR